MEEYSGFHCESFNKDVLLAARCSGREDAACGRSSSWVGATELNGCHEAGSGPPL